VTRRLTKRTQSVTVITLSYCVYVCICVSWMCGCVLNENSSSNNLKLDTVAVLDTMLKPIDFEFKRTRVSGTGPSFQYGDFGIPQYL